MRILQINGERVYRGGERQTLYLHQGLLQRGIDTWLVGQPGSELMAEAQASVGRAIPIAMRGDVDPRAFVRLLALVRRFRPHIIHSQTSRSVLLMGLIHRLTGGRSRLVYTRRTHYSIFRHSFMGFNRWKYLWGCHRLVAISQSVKDRLIEDGLPAEIIDIIPSAISQQVAIPSTAHLERELPLTRPIFGHVARLTAHKGQIHLIEAMPQVIKKLPSAHLVIAGEGELRESLERRAQDLGLADKVHFLGHRQDVEALLRWMDILVMPSVGEALNTTLLNGLRAETPVVVSEVGGMAEVVKHGERGYTSPPGDSSALAATLVKCWENYPEAQEMARVGKEFVARHFCRESMIESYLDLYCDIGWGD